MSFDAFGLSPHIMAGIKAAGYVVPTPIQRETIPQVLTGRDVMGLAQTGTGKTAAFALPILQRLYDGPRRKIRALIVSPTRELAEQTRDSIAVLGRDTRLRTMTIYGGVGFAPQIAKLRSGFEIVVACPGRLLDLMNQGVVDLNNVEVLVIDEADRMFDMGFMPDVKRILKEVPKKRQTLLFSATMPREIRSLADDVLSNPVVIEIDHSQPAKTVSHALYPVEQHLKAPLLISLLKNTETESVLVFTRTKSRTRRVAEQLLRAGFNAASLQGDMPQSKRLAAINGFRDGKYQVLVATDIAARGVDVSGISHVINFDLPDTADAYTHRIGRTGRASKTGKAFSFITKDDASTVRSFERTMNVELVCQELDGFDYGVPAPSTSSTPHHRTSQRNERGNYDQARRKQHGAGSGHSRNTQAPGDGPRRKPASHSRAH